MTTYLFSISYSDHTDITQLECVDNEGAWREALATVGDAFRDIKDEFSPSDVWGITVAHADGTQLFELKIEAYATEAGRRH
jgi:hypothetical protein